MSEYDTRYDGNAHGEALTKNKTGSSNAAIEDDSRYKPSSREPDRGKSRTRDRDHEREKDGNHRSRDYKDRSLRNGRGSDNYDYDRRRSHDHDRNRYYGLDRERRHRNGSPSIPWDRPRNRSRSRSPTKSKRASGFDMAPPAVCMLPGAAIPGQLPGIPQTTTGMFQNAFSFGASQLGSLCMMPMQAMTQQVYARC